MADRRDRLGQPEEENTAIESTQSASGLAGGTPQGGPAEPHDHARRINTHDEGEERNSLQRARRTQKD
jgi:hypothetical protein